MAPYKKILVLLDLANGSEQVALAAKYMADTHAADLVLLHVVEFVPVEPLGDALLPTVQIEEELVKRSTTQLAALPTQLGLTRASTRVEVGNTKAEILRVAEDEHADLILVGSRERHGLAILVNFTEDTILHAAHCDVLAVRLK